jgi:CubicO group peptidase (beta-lactamase class C family)
MLRTTIEATGWGVLGVVVVLAGSLLASPYLRRYALLQNVDVYVYDELPKREVRRSQAPFVFPERRSTAWIAAADLSDVGHRLADARALDAFLGEHGTTAFIAIRGGALAYEGYYNGFGRDSWFKTFSISKSVLSALIGIAIDERLISGVDEPVTSFVPEMRDRGFERVTLRHCLNNTAGIRYTRGVMPWSGQPRMYYTADVRAHVIGTRLGRAPGTSLEPEDLSPLVLGLALERALKRRGQPATIARYLEERIWRPLGAEYDALWNTDHEGDGLEKTESGFTARAIDLAKFAVLYADRGRWQGRQLVPESWVDESTSVDPERDAPNTFANGFHKYLWWGVPPGGNAGDFYANGHFGQRLYVSRRNGVVLVRLGRSGGGVDWARFLGQVAATMGPVSD